MSDNSDAETPADVAMAKVEVKKVNPNTFLVKLDSGYKLKFSVDDDGEIQSFTWNGVKMEFCEFDDGSASVAAITICQTDGGNTAVVSKVDDIVVAFPSVQKNVGGELTTVDTEVVIENAKFENHKTVIALHQEEDSDKPTLHVITNKNLDFSIKKKNLPNVVSTMDFIAAATQVVVGIESESSSEQDDIVEPEEPPTPTADEWGFCCECNSKVDTFEGKWTLQGNASRFFIYKRQGSICEKLNFAQHGECIICYNCDKHVEADSWGWTSVKLLDSKIDIPFIKRLQKEMEEKLKKGFCAECEKELADDELIYIYKIEEDSDECILCQDCNQGVVQPGWKEISLSDCTLHGEFIAKKKVQASGTVFIDPTAEIAI